MNTDTYDEYGVNTKNSFNTSPDAKYKLIDIEDESSNEWSEPVTKKEALEQIKEWNDEMGTDYKSIAEFNEKEQYWKWEQI
jgi:hypothetical protein